MTNPWDIDVTHSAIHFHVRHMIISKVHGRFAKWAGALQLDPQDLTRSSVEVTIDAASIDTQVADAAFGRFFDIAATAVGMRRVQLGNQFADDVADVPASHGILQQFAVALAHDFPVHAVQAGIVEVVAHLDLRRLACPGTVIDIRSPPCSGMTRPNPEALSSRREAHSSGRRRSTCSRP